MIIIGMSGGLGNQLFQYALYKKMLYLGKKVKCDMSIFDRPSEPRKNMLPYLGIEVEKATDEECNKILYGTCGIERLIRKSFDKKKNYIVEDIFTSYNQKILDLSEAYLFGYWQTEKYFSDIKETILKSIHFFIPQSDELSEIVNNIEETNSVSIHVRLGDYVGTDLYDNICNKSYYEKAMGLVEGRIKNVQYFVFSDCIDDARKMFENKNNVTYVDINNDDNSYLDMYLMSLCKHNILANSSFSWWASYLNEHHNKITIAPQKWLNGYDITDIRCENWTLV